jgi:hypothetical protein
MSEKLINNTEDTCSPDATTEEHQRMFLISIDDSLVLYARKRADEEIKEFGASQASVDNLHGVSG